MLLGSEYFRVLSSIFQIQRKKKKKPNFLFVVFYNHSGFCCSSHQCTLFFQIKTWTSANCNHYVSEGFCARSGIHWNEDYSVQPRSSSQRSGSLFQTSFVSIFTRPPHNAWCKMTVWRCLAAGVGSLGWVAKSRESRRGLEAETESLCLCV